MKLIGKKWKQIEEKVFAKVRMMISSTFILTISNTNCKIRIGVNTLERVFSSNPTNLRDQSYSSFNCWVKWKLWDLWPGTIGDYPRH